MVSILHKKGQKFICFESIKLNFNPPATLWWEGVFERKIRCVKHCLREVLDRNTVAKEESQTLLYEIELVLNTRPLTLTCKNPNDTVLAPNQFLYGRRFHLQSIPSRENIVNINSCYHYVANSLQQLQNEYFLNQKLVTKLNKHVMLGI